jgi:hypothetical protein
VSSLNAQDFNILKLALDMLSKHTEGEIAKAGWKGSNAKKLSLLTMRQQITDTRNKLAQCRSAT